MQRKVPGWGASAVLSAALVVVLVAVGACADGGAGRVAPQQPLPSQVNDEVVRDLARAALNDIGIPAQVLVVTRATRQGIGDGSSQRLSHYEVWATVPQCTAGRVVVEISPVGRIEQVYTRYDCRIDGLPAY